MTDFHHAWLEELHAGRAYHTAKKRRQKYSHLYRKWVMAKARLAALSA